MDVGIYVIQAARYTLGHEPIAVTAREYKTDPVKFKEVDEVITWQMEFPEGLVANCTTSFFCLDQPYVCRFGKRIYQIEPLHTPMADWGGNTRKYDFDFPQVNQQALHMDGISDHLLNGTPHLNVGGDEGVRDMIIIDAIFKSVAMDGKRIVI